MKKAREVVQDMPAIPVDNEFTLAEILAAASAKGAKLCPNGMEHQNCNHNDCQCACHTALVRDPLAIAQAAVAEVEQKLTLWQIAHELEELIELREALEVPPEGRDEEAIAATELAIQEYVGREIRKVTGIAALLKHFRSQEEIAAKEEERIAARRKSWAGRFERLKGMVHGVMIAMDLQKLEGATDRFRRQNNPEAVDVVEIGALPDEYLKATIRMPLSTWKFLVETHRLEPNPAIIVVTSEVDTTKLKRALQAKVDCQICTGVGQRPSADGKTVADCELCQGSGVLPNVVPGARLKRGEHLRVE